MKAHAGIQASYEIRLRFPFKKVEDYDHHDEICIRKIWTQPLELHDRFAERITTGESMDYVADSLNDSHKLFSVIRMDNNLRIQGLEPLVKESKIVLEIQRSNKNNFYWIE